MSPARALRWRQVRGDLRHDAAVNVALVVVVALSACLMGTGAMVMERLLSSVDRLFEVAQPPHFLQMHKGEVDLAALTRFADRHPEIESWFVEEMVGFDGAALAWERPATGASGDLGESLIDNLFVAQNETFDRLVDAADAAPVPEDGEVYVPVAYQESIGLQVGDLLTVATSSGPRTWEVRGFVRDAQMASSLSSATRFVVSESDLAALTAAGGGQPEVIVEYLLTDPGLASDLERAYAADPALPKNGQAVTYTMIRTLHAISDGLAAVALVLVAALLIAIALLVIRFVVRGRLEDDVRQIGAMRAIGIPARDIGRVYLTRYSLLAAVGCAVGGALAVLAVPLLTRGVQTHYGAAAAGGRGTLVLLVALAAVALVVVLGCRRALRLVRRVEVVDALVHGSTLDRRQSRRRARRQARRARRTSLAGARGGVTRRLALIDLRADARQWSLVPVVFFLCAFLMGLPAHLLSTLESPRFLTYMGAPQVDVRADLQLADDLEALRTDLTAALTADDRVADVQVHALVLADVEAPDGRRTVRVEVGEGAAQGIEMIDGAAPGPGEIALSLLNAEELQAAVGDTLTIHEGDQSRSVVVSGVYQDVTSGGKTAKMHGDPPPGATGYTFFVDLAEGVDPVALAASYDERFEDVTVLPMTAYVEQTMTHVTSAFRATAVLATAFGLGVATLITVAFLQLRLARERRAMGTLSAVGFSTAEILGQLRGKTAATAAVGAVLGAVGAVTLGGPVLDVLVASAGVGLAHLELAPDPWVATGGAVALAAAAWLAAVGLTVRLRGASTSTWLRD